MKALQGLFALVRLGLRRERVTLPASALLVTLIVSGSCANYARMFPTAEAQRAFAEGLLDNRALVAFGGQLFDLGLGGLTVFKTGDTAYNLVALFAALSVLRHTRSEEESGRHELLAAGAVGRHASLAAALILACLTSASAGLGAALGLVALGLPARGCAAFAIAIASPGFIFSAVAAVAAQLTERARAALGMTGVVIGAGFAARFIADAAGIAWLRWLSPQGMSHEIRAFAEDRVWVFGVHLCISLILGAVAFELSTRRDIGGAFFGARSGRASGPELSSPLALVFRLERGACLAWALGLAALGGLLGCTASSIPEISRRTGYVMEEFLRRFGGGPSTGVMDAFLWIGVMSIGYAASLYPVLATLRMRAEEVSGNAELILSTSVSRLRFALCHVAFGLAGCVVLMTAAGLAVGLSSGLFSGQLARDFPRIFAGALVQIPALWTLGGVAMLAFGALPRQSVAIGWAAFVFVLVFGEMLGPALGIDYWIADQLIPFHHLPRVLVGAPLTPLPLVALSGVTAALSAAGIYLFCRRDLAAG